METNKHFLIEGDTLSGHSFNYQIEKILGQGTYGITYLATIDTNLFSRLNSDNHNDIKVAIKEYQPRDLKWLSPNAKEMKTKINTDNVNAFIFEITNLSKLQHPNIIKFIEAFEANDTIYYVMEYIDGKNLDDYIVNKHGLDEEEAIRIVKQIGSALSYMHSKGIYHFDLKPANIMMRRNGDAVIIDFGNSMQNFPNIKTKSLLSIPGGSAGYAPFEQVIHDADKSTFATIDVYALGATLFKMLTANDPNRADKIMTDGFPLYILQEHDVTNGLSSCIAKAMASGKGNRFQSVEDFLNALDNKDTFTFDYVIANKPQSSMENPAVIKYHIRPETDVVVLKNSFGRYLKSGKFIAIINSSRVALGLTESSTQILIPVAKTTYNNFLRDLQKLELPTKEENTNYEKSDYCTNDPGETEILLYDNRKRLYAKYWIGGWGNELGNIVALNRGFRQELYEKLLKITPYLNDYINNRDRLKIPIPFNINIQDEIN